MRKFRHPRGVPKRIAELTGIWQPTVSNIINGKQRPTPEQALALERAFAQLGVRITAIELLLHYVKGRPLNLWPDRPRVTPRKAERRPRRAKE
jgi:transcriptional regulator with XRE-family HTH domain